MMPEEIRAIVGRYNLSVATHTPDSGDPIYLASYDEVPGCLAEAGGRDEAITELDSLIVPFLDGMIEAGGKIPVPLSERPLRTRSHFIQISNLIVGKVEDLLAANTTLTAGDSGVEVPSREGLLARAGAR